MLTFVLGIIAVLLIVRFWFILIPVAAIGLGLFMGGWGLLLAFLLPGVLWPWLVAVAGFGFAYLVFAGWIHLLTQ